MANLIILHVWTWTYVSNYIKSCCLILPSRRAVGVIMIFIVLIHKQTAVALPVSTVAELLVFVLLCLVHITIAVPSSPCSVNKICATVTPKTSIPAGKIGGAYYYQSADTIIVTSHGFWCEDHCHSNIISTNPKRRGGDKEGRSK